MARIKLADSNFEIIPEGNVILLVTAVDYDPDFGVVEVKMATKDGLKHTERFTLLDKQGQPNPKALVAFSFFARAAMDDPNLDEIDESELVGRYIEAEVTHEKVPHRDDPEKIMTFARLGKKTAVKRFAPGAKAVEAKAVEAKAVEAKAELDLDEIFA